MQKNGFAVVEKLRFFVISETVIYRGAFLLLIPVCTLVCLLLSSVMITNARPNVITSGNHILEKYEQQVSQRKTLRRHIRQLEDCYSNETVSVEGGILSSPNFPNRYPSNQDCRWLLTAPKNDNIVLKIRTLDLENDRNCELDYLQVYLGASPLSPSIGPFCGSIKGKAIVTNTSKVLIVFHSDPSYEDKGFSLEYYLSSSAGCQEVLNADSGVVSSPEFPSNYPDNTDCWTLISVVDNKIILLQFDVLDLEFDENCTYDFVEVFDGATKDNPSFGRFCSSNQKTLIQSTSNALLLHFFSDHLVNKKGFQTHYTSVSSSLPTNVSSLGGCLWESDLSNGTIASPNYPQKYPSNTDCKILLSAPVNQVITLSFDSLQLEIEVNCSYDYIKIIDGIDFDSKIIGTYCGKSSEPKSLTSRHNFLLVIFHSDDFGEFSGFKARYWFHSINNDITSDKGLQDSTIKPNLSSIKNEDELIFLDSPQNATLELGAPYMLPCAASDPQAKIRWLKNEQFLGGNTPLPGLKLVTNNTLWIQSMNKHLVGIYECAAVTPEKTISVKAWVLLKDNFNNSDDACSIVMRKVPRDASFTEGEFAHMECLATGSQVQVQWEKNGILLEPQKHITILKNGFLFIDKITLQDAGLYTCIAKDQIANCQKRVTVTLTVNEKAKIQEICGRPKAGHPSMEKPRLDHGKIVGGHNAEKGAYPWQVMLWHPELKSFCGGSLINQRWIITAAHCFVNYKELRWDSVVIKLGKHNREEYEDGEFQTTIPEPSAVIIHPAYSKETFDNDVALIRLKDHVQFTDFILPICLPDVQMAENITELQLLLGTVTGWGKLKEKGPTPKYLQEIKMPVVNQQICINSTKFMVSRNMFCAGYAQEILGDACHGDSGGPFVVSYHNRWHLLGVVSWGEGCGKANKYGFYTKIVNYLPWIKGIMKS